jgi:hypothetical protein
VFIFLLPGHKKPHQILKLKTNEQHENRNIMNFLVKNTIHQKLLEVLGIGTNTLKKSKRNRHPVMLPRIGKEYGFSDMKKRRRHSDTGRGYYLGFWKVFSKPMAFVLLFAAKMSGPG